MISLASLNAGQPAGSSAPVTPKANLTWDSIESGGQNQSNNPKPESLVDDVSDAQVGAGNQMVSGFNQVKKAGTDFSSGDLKGLGTGAYDAISGAGQEVAGALNGLAAPISGGLKRIGDTNVDSQGDTIGGQIMKNGIQPIADAIGNNPQLQKIVAKYPGIEQDIPNIMTIGLTLLGGDKSPEIKSAGSSAADAVSSVMDSIKNPPGGGGSASPVDTLSSRIKDATPDYSKEMIGTNVKTPDTVDAQGNVVKGQITPRIASEGKGVTGGRPVTVSAAEHAAGTELNNIPNYPDKGSALEKMLATQKAISTEAESMRSGLQAEDKASPLDAQAEKIKVNNLVAQHLTDDIREKLGIPSSEEDTYVKGIQKSLGAPVPEGTFDLSMPGDKPNLPKTALGKYSSDVLDALNNYDGTREGKLDLRQSLDSAYKNARGKLAFGSDSGNTIDEIHHDIRDDLNKDLAATTKDTDTQTSLKRQTNLFKASDILAEKAKGEAESRGGRFLDKHPVVKGAARIGQRVATRTVAGTAARAIVKGVGSAFK